MFWRYKKIERDIVVIIIALLSAPIINLVVTHYLPKVYTPVGFKIMEGFIGGIVVAAKHIKLIHMVVKRNGCIAFIIAAITGGSSNCAIKALAVPFLEH